MAPPLVWLGLAAFGGWVLYEANHHKKQKALGGEENFDSNALAAATELRIIPGDPQGRTARYWRTEVQVRLISALGQFGVEPLPTPMLDGTPFANLAAAAFRIRPRAQAPLGPDAGTALASAIAKGLIGITSLAVLVPADRDDRILVFAQATTAMRLAAQPGSPWAILADPASEAQIAAGGGLPQMPQTPIAFPGGVPIPVPASPGLPNQVPGGLDPTMDAQTAAVVASLLADPNISAADLDQAADAMSASGFPIAAAALHAAAAARRAQQGAQDAARGGMPFTITEGDIPSHLAAYYTGDGNRWRELLAPLNPQLHAGGQFGMTGWKVGDTVLLPLAWNPRKKPRPPPLPSPDAAAAAGAAVEGVRGVRGVASSSAVLPASTSSAAAPPVVDEKKETSTSTVPVGGP